MSDSENKYEIASGKSEVETGAVQPVRHAARDHANPQNPKTYHQPQPVLERSGSMKKFYELANNSIRGKVKKLCSIFESPHPSGDESSVQLKTVKSMVPERVPCVYNWNTLIRLKGM